MNERRTKKIRIILLNFINKELILSKKSKKSKILINSMTLEQLEDKNLQCKDFYIREKDQIYQNVDNGRIICLNIYVNDINKSNPYINSLSNLIREIYITNDIKSINDIKINRIETISGDKETIIQKQSNKLLYILKEGKLSSPVDTSLLIKKELGERKLKRPNNEYNSQRFIPKDNIENIKEKEKEKGKDINELTNNFNFSYDSEELKLMKQLSKETLETDISRIIQVCHEAKYQNSVEHYPSDSRISIISKEIKKAKIYAKKLKVYCRTLKRKLALNADNAIKSNSRFLFEEKMNEIKKKNLYDKKLNDNEENNTKIKKIHSLKRENNNNNNITRKHASSFKKLISDKNIKGKIRRNSFLKVSNYKRKTNSSNSIVRRTFEEKGIKKKYVKITKKKIKNSEIERVPKPKYKTKKDISKLSPKFRTKIKEIKRPNNNHRTMNDLFIVIDSPKLSTINAGKKPKKKDVFNERRKNKISTEVSKESNSKKIIKFRRKFEDHVKNNNKKRTSNDVKIKRSSVNASMLNMPGFEALNVMKTKSKSNNNTSTNQPQISSVSIGKNKKVKKINNKKKNSISKMRGPKDEKKKTYGFAKRKRESGVTEALKKIKKRRTTYYDDIFSFSSSIVSPSCKEEEEKKTDKSTSDCNKKNNNSKKNKIKTDRNMK